VICSSSSTIADSTAIFLLSYLQHDNDKNDDDEKKNYLNSIQFNSMNDVFITLFKLFKPNNVTLNFNKTNFIKFCIHNRPCVELNTGDENKILKK
jgi:hypothetical protein